MYTVLFISSVNLSFNLLSPAAIYEHSTIYYSRVYNLNISATNGSDCIGSGKGRVMELQLHLILSVLHRI